MVALALEPARAAHDRRAAILAEVVRHSCTARDRWIIDVELHVAGNKDVEFAVAIVVTEGNARGPATQGHARFFSNVCESPVVIVVVQAVLSEVLDVQGWPPIVIKIAGGDAEPPTIIRHSNFLPHIRG